jgi:hypothetical protein
VVVLMGQAGEAEAKVWVGLVVVVKGQVEAVEVKG